MSSVKPSSPFAAASNGVVNLMPFTAFNAASVKSKVSMTLDKCVIESLCTFVFAKFYNSAGNA